MRRDVVEAVVGDSQEVIEVEKTVSPKILFGAPNDRPANDWPVFRWRIAGNDDVTGELACVAKPRTMRAFRTRTRESIVFFVCGGNLMAEKRENEITEVAGERHQRWAPRDWKNGCQLTRRECFV